LNDFTHLGKLELRRFEHPKDVQLPWEQITSLKLDNSSVDLCMSLLVRCLNFVEFHAMNCIKPKEHHNLRLSGHAHKFKHLAWGFDDWLDCEFLSHQFRFPSLRTFYWDSPYPYSSRRSTEEEMGALRSLFSNFPPSLSQLLLVGSLAWSDEFMGFVFVKLKGLKMIYLSNCAKVMAVQFLSLLNRMNDWERCCILPLFAQIIIESPPMDNKEYKAQMEDKIASPIISLFHLRDSQNKTILLAYCAP